jgi:hypothetical protein
MFMVLGPAWKSSTRIEQFQIVFRGFFQLDFLNTYRTIYEQLKVFQESLPYPHGGQNLIEIVRHYMPLIYFIGLVEIFVSFVFAPYVLPLFYGLKRFAKRRDHVFMVLLTFFYVLVVYYRQIDMNFISKRYLLTPVFLLYPWIGAGVQNLWSYIAASPRKRFLAFAAIAVFAIAPLYKDFEPLTRQEAILKTAGNWIGQDPRFQEARIMTNDPRIPFYAGRGRDFLKYSESTNWGMEEAARHFHIDLIAIETSKKRRIILPEFEDYERLKAFEGERNIVFIYGSRALNSHQ